jgi:hypothetical protein
MADKADADQNEENSDASVGRGAGILAGQNVLVGEEGQHEGGWGK